MFHVLFFFLIPESKKDSSSSQLQEVESKLQKSVDENKSFIEKIKSLEEKASKQDFSVSPVSVYSALPVWNPTRNARAVVVVVVTVHMERNRISGSERIIAAQRDVTDVRISADGSPSRSGDVRSDDVELDGFPVTQGLQRVMRIFARDAREVNENVFAVVIAGHKAVTVLSVEPLDGANQAGTFAAALDR